MITATIKHLPKSTLELTITIPPHDVKQAYEKIMNVLMQNAEIKGFRKGKAPQELVEKNIDKAKIYQEVLQELLPKAYIESIKMHNLQPIVDPHIQLISPQKLTDLQVGEQLVFKATTAKSPQVLLKNYKEEIRKLKAKNSIWTPGKGDPTKKQNPENKGPSLEDLINILLNNTEVELPDILIEHETNKLLAQTLDEIKRLGLTLEQYLASTKKTAQDMRQKATTDAITDLKLEFILSEIAKEEKISVSQEEIEKVINENKDQKTKEKLRSQSYLLATILLRQKALDFIRSL